jgi:hypothetical protein
MRRTQSMSRKLFGLVGALFLALTACDSTRSGATSEITMLLTDAPGDILEAVVTIEEIYLQGGEGGRTVLFEGPITVDLTDLVNETIQLVEGVVVPAGSYAQLRFVISGGYIRVEGEEEGTSTIFASSPDYAGLPPEAVVGGQLIMPSFDAAGLKVNFPGQLVVLPEGTLTMLLDFDAKESYGREAGDSGDWVLNPLITGQILEE